MVNKPSTFSPSSVYLCTYNLSLCLGWLILFIQFVNHMIYGDGVSGLWKTTSLALLVFQTFAILEIVHCIVGIVRSSALLTFFQVFSRVFLVWAILFSIPDSRSSIGFPMVLFAWCITEIIRYKFYFMSLIGTPPQILVFLRYTLFIGLYPLGVTGEILCYFSALPYVQANKPFSMPLPNNINFAFDSYYALIIVMILYIPVFPKLYGHMLVQRKKILGTSKKIR